MKLTPTLLKQQLEIADALLVGRKQMLEPQDLPERYGRVVKALDRVLKACACEAVVGGNWLSRDTAIWGESPRTSTSSCLVIASTIFCRLPR